MRRRDDGAFRKGAAPAPMMGGPTIRPAAGLYERLAFRLDTCYSRVDLGFCAVVRVGNKDLSSGGAPSCQTRWDIDRRPTQSLSVDVWRPFDFHDAAASLKNATRRPRAWLFGHVSNLRKMQETKYVLSEVPRTRGCSPVGLARGDPSLPIVHSFTLPLHLGRRKSSEKGHKQRKAPSAGPTCVPATRGLVPSIFRQSARKSNTHLHKKKKEFPS
jgi:hypothetical protein